MRIDPYNAEDKNPFTSNAIKSSCWELSSLQTHYLSSVSILAKIFTEVFTKPEFNMEDFMDHGYGTVSPWYLQ
jgi:U3 small nucleolar RNA-associated protein 19